MHAQSGVRDINSKSLKFAFSVHTNGWLEKWPDGQFAQELDSPHMQPYAHLAQSTNYTYT
jgi:hypothetical protein